VQGGRCLADERLDQTHRGPVGAELVHVVEDQHEIALEPLLERGAEERRIRVGPAQLVRVGVGPLQAVGRRAEVGREIGHAEP
jgi:hypothetical protein